VEELEAAYDASGREARRLFDQVRSYTDKEREGLSRVTQLEAELKALKTQSSTYREYSDEEIKRLRDENPGAYFDAIREKEKRETSIKAEKEKAENELKARTEEQAQVKKSIEKQLRTMASDTKRYPGFLQLQGVMDKILDLCPEVAGTEAGPMVVYLAARGLQANRSVSKVQEAEGTSRQEAGSQAQSLADKTGSTGPGSRGASEGGAGVDPINAEIMKGNRGSVLPSFGS